ncbi:MAG: TetR/AcrR family transcriptional regulator [Acidimicrobiales bacterium]
MQRRYDSTRRQEQARQTGDAILAAARRRFLDRGFASTTIASIASDAGVSVDTVYKSFGGKPGLVRAICAHALAGQGPVHAESRSDTLQTTEPDPRIIMQGIGRLTAEVAPRIAPILLLIRDAASADSGMAELKSEMEAQRLERMTHNAGNLATAGHLRPDITVESVAEIMWTYSSPELYELLVINRGWSVERFGTFVGDALQAAIIDPNNPQRQQAPSSHRT